jgi:hypothetical protein
VQPHLAACAAAAAAGVLRADAFHRDVALQVAFERQNFETGFSLDRF